MICLFTDFGAHDPYVGQVHRAIRAVASGAAIVDLFHNLPRYNIRAAAYLAAHYCPPSAGTVFCCVVDPGVGGLRAGLILEIGESLYVGPDNGLFEILLRRNRVGSIKRIDWQPKNLSNSFHGRDVFAPVAARLFLNQAVETSAFSPARFPEWPDDAAEILYMDHYGNAITGMRASGLDPDQSIVVSGNTVLHADTFSDVPLRHAFWYENANGLVEIAANQGSAARMLGLQTGSPVSVSRR